MWIHSEEWHEEHIVVTSAAIWGAYFSSQRVAEQKGESDMRATIFTALLVIAVLSGGTDAQEQAGVNRVPVDDDMFANIADHYGYDRSVPLDAATIGSWPHRTPYVQVVLHDT